MQEIADRRPAVLAALEFRHVHVGGVVDRLDRAFRNRDADQDSHDRFHHRLGNQPVAVGPAVLIMLEQDLLIPGNQEAGNGIARKVFGQGGGAARISIAKVDCRARERPGRGGACDPPRRIDLVEMAECTDAIFRLVWIALESGTQRSRYWKALGRSVAFGVRACRGEHRPGAGFDCRRTVSRLGDRGTSSGSPVCGCCGGARKRRAPGNQSAVTSSSDHSSAVRRRSSADAPAELPRSARYPSRAGPA